MSLLDSFQRYITGSLATPSLPLIQNTAGSVQMGKPPVYPPPNVATYINAYNNNSTIYTIISYISQKFGNIPRFCYAIDDTTAEKSLKWLLKQRKIKLTQIEKLKVKAYGQEAVQSDITPEGKLAALTARPNDYQGQDSFYSEVYLFYELTGEVFVYLNRGLEFGTVYDEDGVELDDDAIKRLPVLEKVVLPTQYVNPVPSASDINEILYYKFQTEPGKWVNIRPVDIIHWKKTNPNYDGSQGTHLRGLATLSAGLRLLTQDNSATDAAVAMQQNQGAKGLLFNKTIANPTSQQTDKIRDVIDTNVNSTRQKGAVGFLGGSDYGYVNFGQSSIDMQLLDSQQQIFVRLCNLFGVPPAIFLTETTYENLQQAIKTLLTNKILPAACSFRDEENRVLLLSFGLDPVKYTTDIDATLITELSEDYTSIATQLSLSPFQTFNEKREAMGLEPMEDPNMDKIYVNNNQISLDDLNVNDGLDSYSGISNPNKPGSGLPANQVEEAGNEGDAGLSNAGRSKPR